MSYSLCDMDLIKLCLLLLCLSPCYPNCNHDPTVVITIGGHIVKTRLLLAQLN